MADDKPSFVQMLGDLLSLPTERQQVHLASLDIPDEMRERLAHHLTNQPGAAEFLEQPLGLLRHFLQNAPSRLKQTPPPIQVGPYRILEPLGEGGMGTVYKAQQEHPVKRIVALKLIKPGLDSRQVIARFESERQALARMEHPQIAKVFDAGTDEQGRPYFAMEFVPGLPLTQFADEHKLSIRQRLELVIQVCDAISHAHTKAIIHRDVKSGNVLAYMEDGKPTVKVIDFGIAKAITGDKLTDLTFHTGEGIALGTYESMSPEQAEGSLDIDTRTDVYSLGVLLYEMLSGSKPFDTRSIRRNADMEIRRMICEGDPPRPSTRLSATESSNQIAESRGTQLRALARQLRKELELIPLKAMRKEKSRRYASPGELARDIQNYLANRPLIASPESRVYLLRKFIRRHAVPLAVAAVIALLLIGGVLMTSIQTLRARHAELQAQAEAGEILLKNRALVQSLFVQGSVLTNANQPMEAASAFDTALAYTEPNIREQLSGFALANLAQNAGTPLLNVVIRPDIRVSNIVISKDALIVVTGYADGLLTANSLVTGQPIWPPQKVSDYTDGARPLALAPDGRVVFSTNQGDVDLVDPATGHISHWLINQKKIMNAGVFTPDQKIFVTTCADGYVRSWNWPDGTPLLSSPLESPPLPSCAAFAVSNSEILIGSGDGIVRFFDPRTGKQTHQPIDLRSAVRSKAGFAIRAMNVSVDHVLAIGTDYGYLALCPIDKDPSPITVLPDVAEALQGASTRGGVQGIFFTPDGRQMFTAEYSRYIHSWAVTNNPGEGPQAQVQRTYVGHTDPVMNLCLLPGGTDFVSSSYDGSVRRWQINESGTIRQLPGNNSPAGCVRFLLDDRIAAAGGDDGHVRLWDVATGLQLHDASQHSRKRVWSLASSKADPTRVYSGGADGMLRCFDLSTGVEDPTREFKFDRCVCGLAYSNSARRMAVGLTEGRVDVLQWQPTGWRSIWNGPKQLHEQYVAALDFSSDEQELVSGEWMGGDGRFHVIISKVTDGTTRIELPEVFTKTLVLQNCTDGRNFLYAGDLHSPRLYSWATGKPVVSTSGHDAAAWAGAVSPDGRFIFSGGEDKILRLWNAQTGEQVLKFTGFSYWLISLALSSDPEHLHMISSTYGDPQQLYLWNLAEPAPFHTVASVLAAPSWHEPEPEPAHKLLELANWYFAHAEWKDCLYCLDLASQHPGFEMPLLEKAQCEWALHQASAASIDFNGINSKDAVLRAYIQTLKRQPH